MERKSSCFPREYQQYTHLIYLSFSTTLFFELAKSANSPCTTGVCVSYQRYQAYALTLDGVTASDRGLQLRLVILPIISCELEGLVLPSCSFPPHAPANTIASLWSPYIIGQTIIFSSCFFLSSFFFSSPNLSGRRLDVYHTWHMVQPQCEFRMQV